MYLSMLCDSKIPKAKSEGASQRNEEKNKERESEKGKRDSAEYAFVNLQKAAVLIQLFKAVSPYFMNDPICSRIVECSKFKSHYGYRDAHAEAYAMHLGP